MNKEGKIKNYPCSTAMFGATEMTKLISRNKDNPLKVTAEVVLPTDRNNSYGCNGPTEAIDPDKIVLVRRGECSFEHKIRNFASAKAVIVLNNEPNHLFVMASSSPTGEMKDFETTSVLITEEDGNSLYEAVNDMRIYGTTNPEFDKNGNLKESEMKEKIVATILVERQTSISENSSEKDNASNEIVIDVDGYEAKVTFSDTLEGGMIDVQPKLEDKEEEKNKWPICSTSPNMLHVLVENNWGIQAYMQKSDGKSQDDGRWSLFILQHNGMGSNS